MPHIAYLASLPILSIRSERQFWLAPKLRNPCPTSEIIRATIVEPLGLSVKEVAEALGVHRVALSRLLNKQAALLPEMAIPPEKVYGADMKALMRMQNDYDIAQTREREEEISVARYVPPVAPARQLKLI